MEINQSIIYFPFYLLQVLRKPKDLEIVLQSIYNNINNNNNTGLIMVNSCHIKSEYII